MRENSSTLVTTWVKIKKSPQRELWKPTKLRKKYCLVSYCLHNVNCGNKVFFFISIRNVNCGHIYISLLVYRKAKNCRKKPGIVWNCILGWTGTCTNYTTGVPYNLRDTLRLKFNPVELATVELGNNECLREGNNFFIVPATWIAGTHIRTICYSLRNVNCGNMSQFL